MSHPYDIGRSVDQQQQQPYQRTREMSIEDLLLENRIIFLAGPITERTASIVIMRMLYLQSIKRDQTVNLYVNSPGGLVDQTMAVYDTMQFLGCDVATYCIGQASSGAAIILAAGTKGQRYALPHAKVMLHQPYSGITGQAEDIKIQAEEILKDKTLLNNLLAQHTGQDAEKIAREIERDRYMNAQEALEYGLVDEILVEPENDKKKKKKS
jgi:ATP-dependent Clp protease protease subunit